MPAKGLKHKVGLEHHGIKNAKEIYWNLTTPELYEHIVRNGEARFPILVPWWLQRGNTRGVHLMTSL